MANDYIPLLTLLLFAATLMPIGIWNVNRHNKAYEERIRRSEEQLMFEVYGPDWLSGGQRFAAVWRSLLTTSVSGGPGAYTNSTSATLSFGSNDPWARFECQLDGSSFSSCTSPKTYLGLAEGSHSFHVRALDRDSLRDPVGASRSWVVDLTPPIVDLVRPAPGFTYTNDAPSPRDDGKIKVVGSVTVQAVATDALSGVASVAFTVDGNPVPAAGVSFTAPSTWSFTFTPTQKGQTTYTIGVTATDKAGNSASDSISVLGVKTGKP